jgi:hypothetical protein
LFVFWIVSIYWTFPKRRRTGKRPRSAVTAISRREYLVPVFVTVVYALTASWFVWETRFRHVDGVPKMRDPYARQEQIYHAWIIAQAKAEQLALALKIEQFVLIKDETTFVERDSPDFSNTAKGGRISRSFAMNPEWFDKRAGGCMNGMYDKFFDALDGDIITMSAFTYYVQKFKKERLYPYLEKIIIKKSRRPDIENQLYPTSAELEAMRQDADEPNSRKYAMAIMNWIKHCVGIPYPVFRITVSNNDTSRMLQFNRLCRERHWRI